MGRPSSLRTPRTRKKFPTGAETQVSRTPKPREQPGDPREQKLQDSDLRTQIWKGTTLQKACEAHEAETTHMSL